MSSYSRRRKRVGSGIHGGTSEETLVSSILEPWGDGATAGLGANDEDTALIPDHPNNGSAATTTPPIGDVVNRSPV